MPSIPASQAQGLFYQMLIDVYREYLAPSSFFQSFFPTEEAWTRYVSIEVERNGEPIAVDVKRGTAGNLNTFSNSTTKEYDPPYFKEFFNITEIMLYDRVFGTDYVNDGIFTQFLDNARIRLIQLTDKIKRAYEKMCADVLLDGAVTLQGVDSIDYKRRAQLLVSYSAGINFADDSVNPYNVMEDLIIQMRKYGRFGGGTVNIILGRDVWRAFQSNAAFEQRADQKNVKLDSITTPQRSAIGSGFHGEITVGTYTGRIWTSTEYYTDGNGVEQEYMHPKKLIILPEAPRFKMAYAAVPQIPKIDKDMTTFGAPEKGAFTVFQATSEMQDAMFFGVKSAGVPVPVAVDQIATAQVIADDEES
jgi:hypothetical protein